MVSVALAGGAAELRAVADLAPLPLDGAVAAPPGRLARGEVVLRAVGAAGQRAAMIAQGGAGLPGELVRVADLAVLGVDGAVPAAGAASGGDELAVAGAHGHRGGIMEAQVGAGQVADAIALLPGIEEAVAAGARDGRLGLAAGEEEGRRDDKNEPECVYR